MAVIIMIIYVSFLFSRANLRAATLAYDNADLSVEQLRSHAAKSTLWDGNRADAYLE